ncbi:AIR synthase-related protein, partial [Paraburkholderia phenazinium]|uniref:AIR synthase-related protein n=1 Tax=Paraburkholderia phenazinium TaxID=60549 RepID=UPI001FC919A2
LLPALAEDGLCEAAKDISMAGLLGTALMLLEASQVGARIDLDAVPRPEGVDFDRWLAAFPSYGFLLSVREARVAQVVERFVARGLACAPIGVVDASRELVLAEGGETGRLWDLRETPFIGAAPGAAR